MAASLFTSKTGDPILVRPATFADLEAMASTAWAAYDGTLLDKFVSPLRAKYPADTLRSYYQRLSLRWLSPRNLSFVACAASSPETAVVGYTQLQRLGDDEEAKRQIASRQTVWLTLLSWFCRVKFRVVNYVWPDRSRNVEALRKFEEWAQTDDEVHWNSFPERANRWHLQSMVVSREWQGKGIGKRLIGEVLDRASKEGGSSWGGGERGGGDPLQKGGVRIAIEVLWKLSYRAGRERRDYDLEAGEGESPMTMDSEWATLGSGKWAVLLGDLDQAWM